jgi:hypothetical protein
MTGETGRGFAPRWNQAPFLLAPLCAYLAAAVVTTWPLALHPRSLLGAPSGPGDPFLNLWILGWDMQAVLSGPASILTGRVFNANIFHPAAGTLAYSDHLLLQSVLISPLYAITHDVVACYNLLLIGSLVASALAMHLFVRSVICTESGAYLAGLAWGFGSYRFAHLIHLQLQSLYFLPLAFLFLHRVIAGRRRRDVIYLGVVAGLQALSSVYYGVIGGLALAVGGVALAIGVGRWRSSALLRRLVAAGALGALIVAPVAVVYWRVGQSEGFGRNLYEAGRNAAYVSSYLQVPPGNMVYGRTDLLRQRDRAASSEPPHTGPERELFPGFVLIALAIAGAWLGWRSDSRPIVLTMVAIAILGFVLSLGPDGIRPLYAAFHRFVFGFQAIRAPARFSVVVLFALCTLAAIGWRELSPRAHGVWPLWPQRRISHKGHEDHYGKKHGVLGVLRGQFVFVIFVAAVLEWLHIPISLTAAPPLRTDVGQWLAGAPEPGAVAILPLDADIASTPAMVQSLEYRRPIVNGYSGQRPSFYRPLIDALNTFPSGDALLALRDSGVRFVVTPAPIAPSPGDGPSPAVERARFNDGTIYELRWTPDIDARLAATSTIDPTPAGSIPFHVGEIARYRVVWGSAGLNLSAGDIVISVEPPAYRLVVTAATAPWVAKFFEARDVFATQASADLLPEVHERDQQEGSRHVTRAFLYDHATGVVRTGRSVADARAESAVVLPMFPHARDAIAALFYARTLPLREGEHYRFPVNEAGRNLVVELSVDGRDNVRVQGQDVEALRITPRLQRRVEEREQLKAILWLSNEPRRIPLALDLDAGFGHVRVELESYRSAP